MPKQRVEKSDFPRIFAAAVLGFFLTQIFFLMAISRITPMDCSIITSLSPVYTMFIAAYVLKEPLSAQKIGGVVLSLCGIVYLILNSVTSSTVAQTTPLGVILMIGNSLSFSLYLGIFKPTIAKYTIVTFMKWIFLFASAFSLPMAAHELVTFDYNLLSGIYLSELAFLIICSTFITYFLIPLGQKRIRPTLVSMYSYVQPIIAIIISIWVGMDTVSWQKVLAAAMVFGGVVLVNYSRSAKSA
jgi:drug/metabolite transporter (DMT)-like permease